MLPMPLSALPACPCGPDARDEDESRALSVTPISVLRLAAAASPVPRSRPPSRLTPDTSRLTRFQSRCQPRRLAHGGQYIGGCALANRT